MKKLVIAASYFGTNLGDEAILEAIINVIYKVRSDVEITVLAWDVKRVKEFHKGLFIKYKIKTYYQPGGVFQIKEINKAIVESKKIESATSIQARVKHKVFEDLEMVFQKRWLEEGDVKNLINFTIDSTIIKLSEEQE